MIDTVSGADACAIVEQLLASFTVGVLITRTSADELHARPLNLRKEPTTFAGDLWFLTGRHSRKVSELRNGPVSVVFQNEAARTYVHLRGHGTISDDRDRLEALWDPTHLAWYPGGLDDPELTLLHVTVTDGEYWVAATEAETSDAALTALLTHEPQATTRSGSLSFR